MKKSLFLFTALVALFLLGACKKEVVGPQGPPGPAGPQGNANVTIHKFPAHDFATGVWTASIAMSQSEYESNIFFVSIVRSSGLSYPLPGVGVNGATEYRTYNEWYSNTAVFTIAKLSGPGEQYSEIRVIQISE